MRRSVAHQRQHRADARVVFAQSSLGGSGCGEESPAQSATQPFQFEDCRVEEPCWIPRNVVIDNDMGAMQVHAFGQNFRGDEDAIVVLGMSNFGVEVGNHFGADAFRRDAGEPLPQVAAVKQAFGSGGFSPNSVSDEP